MLYIQAANLTPEAKDTALEAALIAFQNDTFDANTMLARVMEHADLRLVTEFDATTGILPQNQILKGAPHREPSGKIHKAPKSEAVNPPKPPKPLPPGAFELNALQDAEWMMQIAPDAASFETARGAARTAADTYYGAIALGLRANFSGDILKDKLHDNERAWTQHLHRIDTATNRHAEKAARDAESLKNTQDRDLQKKTDTVQRTLEKIDDLRESVFETEQERQRAIVDLEKETARERLDIEKEFYEDLEDLEQDRNRKGADLHRDFLRDLEDLKNETARRLFDVVAFDELDESQRAQVEADLRFRRERSDLKTERTRAVQGLSN